MKSEGGCVMVNFRNTWAEIDLDKISHNVRSLAGLLPKGHRVMGVVKGDGYGHGSVQVAQTLTENGVDFLMVALLEEAVTLRKGGIRTPILVVGRTNPAYAHVAAAYDITLTVFQKDWLDEVATKLFEKPLNVHIEFETGMNRTGIVTEQDLRDIVSHVERNDQIEITGAYTHFATADEINSSQYETQHKRYHHMLGILASLVGDNLITHIGNSAAGIQYSQDMLDYTRFGVSLYGIYPSNDVASLDKVSLEQAMHVHSEISQIKQVRPGDAISYGATYTADEEEWIATVPIGYADGWSRSLQGFYVLVDGKRCPIVGRICMDSMMIKVDQYYEPGKRVTLIGENNGDFITMEDVASHLGTIGYEIPVMLTSRIPREYKL